MIACYSYDAGEVLRHFLRLAPVPLYPKTFSDEQYQDERKVRTACDCPAMMWMLHSLVFVPDS